MTAFIDKRVVIDLIYLDFFTTLDMVPPGKFSLKMVVSTRIVSWIKNYRVIGRLLVEYSMDSFCS